MAHVKVKVTDKLKTIAKERNLTPEELVINYVAFAMTIDQWTEEDSRIEISNTTLVERSKKVSFGVGPLKKN